ncbi:Tropinesterase [compost metagenome]
MKKIWLSLVMMLAFAGVSNAAQPLDQETFASKKVTIALSNGIKMGYVEFGNPTGEPIILIHGYTDNARAWSLVIPYLDQSKRIIAIDLRGHGITSAPECCYGFSDLAYDVKLFMDALQISKATVAGHSLGSIVTQSLAERYPERIKKAILVASGENAAHMKAGGELAVLISDLKEKPAPDSEFLKGWYSTVLPVDPEFIKYEKMESSRVPLHVWKEILFECQMTEFGRQLWRIKAPTLLVYGAHDSAFSKESQNYLRSNISNIKYIEYSEAGHNVPWELPKELALNIDDFMKGKDTTH